MNENKDTLIAEKKMEIRRAEDALDSCDSAIRKVSNELEELNKNLKELEKVQVEFEKWHKKQLAKNKRLLSNSNYNFMKSIVKQGENLFSGSKYVRIKNITSENIRELKRKIIAKEDEYEQLVMQKRSMMTQINDLEWQLHSINNN